MLSILFALAGCGDEPVSKEALLNQEVSIQEVVDKADPDKAVEEIYKSVDVGGITTGNLQFVSDTLGIDPGIITGFSLRYSSGDYGLADVIIIRPDTGKKEDVRTALLKYQENRTAQFKNYDILDAYSIAQNGLLYTQGDYIVLLMLADTASAQEIIDLYIPR